MAIQIANPTVVAKIEALAETTGLTKTAAVEQAVDAMLNRAARRDDVWDRFAAILAQLDRVPKIPDPVDPLAWDEHGLPR
ncbi:MAG TPA: type II toxin-antitoxin system VapB family antitoxin [Stellaceae bacterium]|nr:type II toxin-antitoxin system VapB family antitoxin [Stellaceae bacterium]